VYIANTPDGFSAGEAHGHFDVIERKGAGFISIAQWIAL
jgi:hypothetical protein